MLTPVVAAPVTAAGDQEARQSQPRQLLPRAPDGAPFLLSTRARREVGSPRGTLPAHRDQPPDVVARDVVERRRAVSLASGSFASRTRRRPRDISHAPIGLINAINDGAARGWITASFAGTLVTQMQAGDQGAAGRLRQREGEAQPVHQLPAVPAHRRHHRRLPDDHAQLVERPTVPDVAPLSRREARRRARLLRLHVEVRLVDLLRRGCRGLGTESAVLDHHDDDELRIVERCP